MMVSRRANSKRWCITDTSMHGPPRLGLDRRRSLHRIIVMFLHTMRHLTAVG
jgi:hypothetical protein